METFLLFTSRLNAAGLKYMVSGSIAAMFYGEPRMTNDVDIILILPSAAIDTMIEAFPLEEFYLPPKEVIEDEINRPSRGHFNIIHHASGFKADIYLSGNDSLHRWALERTTLGHLDDESVAFAPPEYVIVRKLQFFHEGRSSKHLRDISRMLTSLGSQWDRTTVEQLVDTLGLSVEWLAALQTVD